MRVLTKSFMFFRDFLYVAYMTGAYERNKVHYYNWILNNPEKYKENNRRQQVKKDARKRAWKTISEDFRNILIEDLKEN